MTISANTVLTYTDLMKMTMPDGSIGPVTEILNATNEGILEYMNFMEGNLPTGHRHQVRSGLPTVSRGRINRGVKATKGDTVQVTDNVAEYESMAEVGAKLLEMASDPGQVRFNHEVPHIESMHQRFFMDLFYGDERTEADNFTGLTPRYSDTDAMNADNILNGGEGLALADATDLRSIWLLCWSPTTCSGIIPKRSVAGLQREDLGVRWLEDDGSDEGRRIKIYATYFRWLVGLAIPDWRYVVRIANLPVSQIADDGSYGPHLPTIMKDAIERIPGMRGNCAFYMPRALRSKLRKQVAAGVEQSTLTMENVGGLSPRKMLVFDEAFPVFRTDALVPRVENDPKGAVTSEDIVVFA